MPIGRQQRRQCWSTVWRQHGGTGCGYTKGGHGLHQLVDVGAGQGFCIRSRDTLDLGTASCVPVLDDGLVGGTDDADLQIVTDMAEP